MSVRPDGKRQTELSGVARVMELEAYKLGQTLRPSHAVIEICLLTPSIKSADTVLFISSNWTLVIATYIPTIR
jgi:hypothetical protein